MEKPQASPQKLTQKVIKTKPAAEAGKTPAAAEAALQEKKLSKTGIALSLFIGLVAGCAVFITTSQLFLAIGVFAGIVVIMLAFLTGAISLSSILSDEPEEEHPEELEHHDDEHHGSEEHYE